MLYTFVKKKSFGDRQYQFWWSLELCLVIITFMFGEHHMNLWYSTQTCWFFCQIYCEWYLGRALLYCICIVLWSNIIIYVLNRSYRLVMDNYSVGDHYDYVLVIRPCSYAHTICMLMLGGSYWLICVILLRLGLVIIRIPAYVFTKNET